MTNQMNGRKLSAADLREILESNDMFRVKNMLWLLGISNDNQPNYWAHENLFLFGELLATASKLQAKKKLNTDVARFLIARLAKYVDVTEIIDSVVFENSEEFGTFEHSKLPNSTFRKIKRGHPDETTDTGILWLNRRQFVSLISYIYNYMRGGKLNRRFNKPILLYLYDRYHFLEREDLLSMMARAFDCVALLQEVPSHAR